MAKYQVWVNFSGYTMYTVEAESPSEAQEIAIANMSISDCDEWDWDIGSVNCL